MWFSGVADPVCLSKLEKRNRDPALVKEKLATWLTELSLAGSGGNSKFVSSTPQSFLEISWLLQDEKKTAGPSRKEEHPTDIASPAHALEEYAPRVGSEARGPRHGIVSDGFQSWGIKKVDSGVLPPCSVTGLLYLRTEHLYGEGLWLTTGGIFLAYH
jgi:hypothetical protein